jgi:3-hydroxyacyl-CoA dehydrogenase/3a,7a,12a-trihydroxy-5b-cholest-24-enoyl-CoA hydratase
MFILDMMEGMRPDLVAPVVLWLCHDSCTDTGSVIEAAAGWVGKCELIILCLNHVR